MAVDRLDAEVAERGDLAAAQALGDETKHVVLALRQGGSWRGRWRRGRRPAHHVSHPRTEIADARISAADGVDQGFQPTFRRDARKVARLNAGDDLRAIL